MRSTVFKVQVMRMGYEKKTETSNVQQLVILTWHGNQMEWREMHRQCERERNIVIHNKYGYKEGRSRATAENKSFSERCFKSRDENRQ